MFRHPFTLRMTAVVMAVVMFADTTDLYDVRKPRVAAGSTQGSKAVTAVEGGTYAGPAAGPAGPAGHLPVGFDDAATFHESLVPDGEGHFKLTYQDVTIPGAGPGLGVRRTYSSHGERAGPFGLGWGWNYGVRLTRDEQSGRPVVLEGDDRRVHFRAAGSDYASVGTA